MRMLGRLCLLASLSSVISCSRLSQSAPATAAEQEAAAESKLCKNMTDGGEAIREFPEVSGGTALSDVKKASDKVEKAIVDVQKAGKRVNNPGLMEVQSAYTELKNSVNGIPGGRSTVGDASDDVNADARELQSEWQQLYANLQCGA
jgi:hypothetical protein